MKEFLPFRLDLVNQCLWRGDHGKEEQRILLSPKAFAMLRYLVERAGRLVTQEELLQALWPGTYVQPEVAIAEDDLARAQDCITQAVLSMEGFEVPLAGWRVHATAAELYRHTGDPASAEKHRELSRATIMKLANSLPMDEPLRQTFLSAPMIRKILEDPFVIPGT